MASVNKNIVNEEVKFNTDEEFVLVTDTQGVVQYANDNFCKVAG